MTVSGSPPPGQKAIHDRLARLLIVNGELYDRLQRCGQPPDLQTLLTEAEVWLRGPEAHQNGALPPTGYSPLRAAHQPVRPCARR